MGFTHVFVMCATMKEGSGATLLKRRELPSETCDPRGARGVSRSAKWLVTAAPSAGERLKVCAGN